MPPSLRRVRRLICAAALVVPAVLTGASALSLLQRGMAARKADPALPVFTREGVLQSLEVLCMPLALCAGIVLFCTLWSVFVPDKPQRSRPVRPRAGRPLPCAGRIRLVLYLLAAVLIIAGVLNGGLRDVLVKAINICTECIGLG